MNIKRKWCQFTRTLYTMDLRATAQEQELKRIKRKAEQNYYRLGMQGTVATF